MPYCGGADSAVSPLHFTGFGRLRALTTKQGPDAVRPFDVEHCGFAPSEGSAFFVLERESHAVARGARPMAYIAGYSNGCAGHALGSGDVDTVVQGWTTCIAQAGWKADDVDLVYAHGNGTIRFDDIEAMAAACVCDNQPA